MSKELINLSNLQRFLSKLNEKFALKKAMKGISEDSEGNIIIGEEGLVPTPNENSKGKFLRSDGEWALPSETAVYDSMTLEEGVAGVSKVDRVINAKNLKQIVNSDGFLTSLDSSKLTGIINIENLPQGALERILIVSSKEERLTLLDTEVQLGDVVKEVDTGLMYYVINTEKLNSEEGYTQFTAGQASSVPWSGVTDKPTIPTKTSDLTNDSDFAIDNNVVHKSGDEYINGTKMFSNTISRYSDLTTSGSEQVYNFYDTNTNSCGHIFNNVHWGGDCIYNRHGAYNNKSGKTMEITIASNDDGFGMVSVEGTATKGNLETATSDTGHTGLATMGWVNNPATSTNVVHRSGNETINGVKTFTSDIYFKNNYIDLTVTPPSNLYSNFIFTDKNNQVVSYIQYAKTTNDDVIGLFVKDADQGLHGIQITSNNYVLPLANNSYNLGLADRKWANAYISNTYTNRVTAYSITHPSGDNNSYFYMSGGSDYDKGATLYLGGVSATNFTPGRFALAARKTDGSSIELAGSPNGTLTWNGKNVALDENLVHRSGDENIAGNKLFGDKIICTRFTHYANNSHIYLTGGIEWDKGATLVLHGEESSDAGAFTINSRDKTRSLYLVGRPDGTLQWAGQNIALDGNLVHKTGDETIGGTKTFSSKIVGNLQGNADTSTYATSAGSANSVAWANVTGKPNLAGTTFVKGTNYWYRKHSDGFIEMGGFTDCAYNKEQSVVATNLPLAFSNTNYTLLVQLTRGTNDGGRWGDGFMCSFTQRKTTTGFKVYSYLLTDTGVGGYDWYACGY